MIKSESTRELLRLIGFLNSGNKNVHTELCTGFNELPRFIDWTGKYNLQNNFIVYSEQVWNAVSIVMETDGMDLVIEVHWTTRIYWKWTIGLAWERFDCIHHKLGF